MWDYLKGLYFMVCLDYIQISQNQLQFHIENQINK